MVVVAVMAGAAAWVAAEDHDGDVGDDNDGDTELLRSCYPITVTRQIQREQ